MALTRASLDRLGGACASALVVFALLMIVPGEVAGARGSGVSQDQHEADQPRAKRHALAIDVAHRRSAYAGAPSRLGRDRLAEHEHDFWTQASFCGSERTLIAPLDPVARGIVATSAKRVSVVTAVSPNAVVDMLFVGGENLRMLRRLATLYGARPGTLSLLKLARMVVTHIVLTGGIALGDDLIHQVIGHGVTAKLSARLGEGLFNGALTTRIGIATIDVCRPLPYIESQRPRFRELVANRKAR